MKETNKKKGYAAEGREPDKLIYVTVAVMLIVMAVIVGVTAAARRSRGSQPPESASPTLPPSSSIDFQEQTTTAPLTEHVTTEAPITTPAQTSPVVAAPSELEIPVKGTLIKEHSPDVLVRSLTMNDYRTHPGIDIAAAIGAPVVACADGIIKEVWADPMMGRCVSVAHEGGLVSVFKNLADSLADGIAPGKELRAGDVIGAVGETALIEIAEVPHLHFELILDGKTQNPLSYFAEDVFAPAEQDYEN